MGGAEVIVPPGVRVEVLGIGIMGGFEASAGTASTTVDTGPVIRLTGVAVMGGVVARHRKPQKKLLKRFESALRAARQLAG
jgi:hypothetical protein